MPPPKDVGMQLVASWGGGKVARWQGPPVGGAPVGGVDGSVKKLQGKTANGEWQRQRFERDPHKGGKNREKAKKGNVSSGKAQLEKNGKYGENKWRRVRKFWNAAAAEFFKCLNFTLAHVLGLKITYL